MAIDTYYRNAGGFVQVPGFVRIGGQFVALSVVPQPGESDAYLSDPFYNSVVAFSGAQGYGANATGGRGNGTPGSTQLLFVDNLNDSGAGSLRAALEATGKRVIVPRVSGYVPLQSRIEPTGDFTFLGQLAPGGFGVKPASLPLNISGYLRIVGISNVIVRYLTVRSGENGSGYASNDGVRISGATNVIVDHVSTSYATDELLEVTGTSDRVTVQNCLLSYPLEYAGHPEITHGLALLMMANGRVSVLRTLISSVRERVPEAYGSGGPLTIQWVGNLIYNSRAGAVSFLTDDDNPTSMDFMRNTYKAGPWTNTDKDIRFRNRSGVYNARNQVYLEGNRSRFVSDPDILAEQPLMARVLSASPVTTPSDPTNVNEWIAPSSVGTPEVRMLTADEFAEFVFANAGNSLYRDSIDTRAVQEAINGTGRSSMYTTAASAGGYPTLPSGSYPAAADGVISDAWRASKGETREWYEIDSGGTGRMIVENYADDVAAGTA